MAQQRSATKVVRSINNKEKKNGVMQIRRRWARNKKAKGMGVARDCRGEGILRGRKIDGINRGGGKKMARHKWGWGGASGNNP